MEYREHPPGDAISGLVKSCWTLAAGGDPGEWIEHRAVPDGCVELIARLAGRSHWGAEQPACFAVGLSETPVAFRISGDSRFAAIRLWPWAWPLLSAVPLAELRDRWIAIEEPLLRTLVATLPDLARAETALAARLAGAADLAEIGRALVGANSVAEMTQATGLPPRALQRWFARQVGMPPRRYLRLLRFHKAFEQVPGQSSLAGHAAEHGFADQAHMAREFRSMAGVPAKQARRSARGPFLR